MKAFLYSFLAVGLTGVFAAPAANTAPERELEAGAPCTITCKPGFFAEYNAKTKKCKCVKVNEEICLRETVCIGTHYASWDPKTQTCSCQPYDFVAEEKCLQETVCIATHHPVWNAATKKCTCEPYDFNDPEKDRCLLATTCLQGSHPFWNPLTSKCSCNPDDGEFICKAATTCSPGSTPIWHPITETCICEKATKRQDTASEEWPDPKTCPNVRCGEGTQPKYVPGKSHCICEKIPATTTTTTRKSKPTEQVPHPSTCPTIKCASGYKPYYNPKTKLCSCKPDPTQCAGWMCIAEQTPVYDPITGKCGCQWIPGLEPKPVDPCADIICIAEMTPKVNATTGTCQCEWIPGLEPGAPTEGKRDAIEGRTPEAEAEPQKLHPACKNIVCIAEKRPVYNATTKRCQCEWIPGFGPVTLAERDAEPQTIKPLPITTTTSSSIHSPTDPLGCYYLKIYCEGGDHHMHYNPKTKQCECPPVKPTKTKTTWPGPTLPPPI